MMWFLEFVACGRGASRRTDQPPAGSAQNPAPLPESASPNGGLAIAPVHEKRRRRAGASLWRPALGAISEDGGFRAVVPARSVGCGRRQAQTNHAGNAKAKPSARVTPPRGYTDHDHRHFTAAPSVIPIIFPATFLF